jgi:hypothetical protein
MSDAIVEQPAKKVPDKVRIQRAAKYYGTRAMVYLAIFAALDAWIIATDGLLIAQLLGVVAAFLTGNYLAGVFHEWGHFIGARVSKSYSPIVPKPGGALMFGFDNSRNTSQQFLTMSIAGSAGNWLLVILAAVLLPIDNIARVALLATVFGRAIGVLIFEGPIMLGVMNGGEPKEQLEKRVNAGGLDISQVQGNIVAGLAFVAGLVYL